MNKKIYEKLIALKYYNLANIFLYNNIPIRVLIMGVNKLESEINPFNSAYYSISTCNNFIFCRTFRDKIMVYHVITPSERDGLCDVYIDNLQNYSELELCKLFTIGGFICEEEK